MRPNQRARALTGSPTLALDGRAKDLMAAGVDVVNMAVGEPDFDAPEVVQRAAERAVRSGAVRYTPPAGRPSLRAAIARHLSATRGIPFAPAEVAVCHSAKHALSNTVLVLVEPGDEVLLPDPIWSSYEEQVRFAGGVPVHVPPRPDLGPDFEGLARAAGPRARGIMMNSPCNPSGYVWSDEDLERLAELAEARDLWILSDEIYRRLVYDGPPAKSPAQVSAAARSRTIIVDGASKSFAMTGYRIGFLAGAREVVEAAARLQSQLTGCPNAISQSGYEAALAEEPPEVESMARAFAERRDFLLRGLAELGLETPEPRGAFYAFPSVAPFLDARGAAGFCEDLLEAEAVALVPGEVFGMREHVRLSYATSLERVGEALARLARFLAGRGRPVARAGRQRDEAS